MVLSARQKYYIKQVVFHVLSPFYHEKRKKLFEAQREKGVHNIPIFIISYNRLSYLSNIIHQLEQRGFQNIKIIDNCSDYPPLLEYYKKTEYEVFRLQKNLGHKAFWTDPVFDQYRKNFYVMTDPDLEIDENCPNDFLEKFFELLWKFPYARKVGFSLKIDDIPDNVPWKKEIVEWEEQYHKIRNSRYNAFYAGIDTTFALYVPDDIVYTNDFVSAFRTEYPYEVRHLPWYKSPDEITEEDKYYSSHKTNGWWDVTKGCMIPDEQ